MSSSSANIGGEYNFGSSMGMVAVSGLDVETGMLHHLTFFVDPTNPNGELGEPVYELFAADALEEERDGASPA